MKLEILEKIIQESWNRDTCYPKLRNEWTPENQARGQCAVTALIVQDYVGGDLLYCRHNEHYWNRLPSGEEIDLTRRQFSQETTICLDETHERDFVLNSEEAHITETSTRYQILKERVDKKLE